MKNKIFINRFYSLKNVAQLCVLICAIILFIIADQTYQYILAGAEALIFAVLIVLNILEEKRFDSDTKEYIKKINSHMDSATKDTLANFPFPMVVTHLDGRVSWYNNSFAKIIKGESLYERQISDIISNLKWSDVLRMHDGISIDVEYKGREYTVEGSIIKSDPEKESEFLVLLYWLDRTKQNRLERKYLSEKTDCCNIVIDNYDDVMNATDDTARPKLISLIDQKINAFIKDIPGILKKTERDRYLFFFEHAYLDKIVESKFEVLDWIRELDVGNKMPATISIGIGNGGENISENDNFSRAALDMALGRGGDQAVIKDESQFRFFGGKTREHEKSTRVKARVIAFALRQLMSSKENVVIMGHKNPDTDSLGASVGLAKSAMNNNNKVYIVCGEHSDSVENIISGFKAYEEYNDVFISPEKAEEIVGENTVLIVVDTHRPSLVENQELLKKAGEVVLVDHHRRSTDFIENCSLVYHEPYASSSCELVAELLQYMDNKIPITKYEAEAIYAGIYMDTKNFVFKTGVRTFDAASYLRKHGVDTIAVKKRFQYGMEQFCSRASIIECASVEYDNIAIAVYDKSIEDVTVVAAQAADELLNIEGIEASFVIAKNESGVVISGRSWGSINVQLILEKIGGGGHATVAGAQIQDCDTTSAKDSLTGAIGEYLSDNNK